MGVQNLIEECAELFNQAHRKDYKRGEKKMHS